MEITNESINYEEISQKNKTGHYPNIRDLFREHNQEQAWVFLLRDMLVTRGLIGFNEFQDAFSLVERKDRGEIHQVVLR